MGTKVPPKHRRTKKKIALRRPVKLSVPSRSQLAQARARALVFAVFALGLAWALVAPGAANAEEVNYSSVRAVALPPSSSFKTSESGGDGWALAFSESAVYNVYHHRAN